MGGGKGIVIRAAGIAFSSLYNGYTPMWGASMTLLRPGIQESGREGVHNEKFHDLTDVGVTSWSTTFALISAT